MKIEIPPIPADIHWHPRVLLKLAICQIGLGAYLNEFCNRCGRRVRDIWWSPKSLWDEVEASDATVRCIRCFALECKEHGILVQWWPMVAHRKNDEGQWAHEQPIPLTPAERKRFWC